MSAPMPDFGMPEASDGPRRRVRLPRGPRARRALGIGVVAVVVAALAIVGVPALVDQQRGRDAVAVVERYAADVADGDVDAVLAAQAPDADEASDALLRDGLLAPTAPLVVDAVELLSVDGPRAAVRVRHSTGPDDGSSVVVLVDRGGEWRIVEGLLGAADVPYELALALGDDEADGRAWLLPGRYGLESAPVGAVAVRSELFVVTPGERTAVTVEAVPTMASTSLGVAATRSFVEEHRATCGDTCLLLGDETDIAPTMTWDLDLETRTGTMLAMITTTVEEQTGSGQIVARSQIANVAFDVVIADDLQSLVVTPASPVAAP